jgi:hypothetical protein
MAAIESGCALLRSHSLFSKLAFGYGCQFSFAGAAFPSKGYARLHSYVHPRSYSKTLQTDIEVNPWRRAAPEEWAHVLGQALLHYYFCHADPGRTDDAWSIACEIIAVDWPSPGRSNAG